MPLLELFAQPSEKGLTIPSIMTLFKIHVKNETLEGN
jgi:hypothetical protein